jgi:hypothetical protein
MNLGFSLDSAHFIINFCVTFKKSHKIEIDSSYHFLNFKDQIVIAHQLRRRQNR